MSGMQKAVRDVLNGAVNTADALTSKAFRLGPERLTRSQTNNLLIQAYTAGWVDGRAFNPETSDSFVPDIWSTTDGVVQP